jgi:hypothetical protein
MCISSAYQVLKRYHSNYAAVESVEGQSSCATGTDNDPAERHYDPPLKVQTESLQGNEARNFTTTMIDDHVRSLQNEYGCILLLLLLLLLLMTINNLVSDMRYLWGQEMRIQTRSSCY